MCMYAHVYMHTDVYGMHMYVCVFIHLWLELLVVPCGNDTDGPTQIPITRMVHSSPAARRFIAKSLSHTLPGKLLLVNGELTLAGGKCFSWSCPQLVTPATGRT